jgi:ribosomal protein S18 acetylase RimI-like enzyme
MSFFDMHSLIKAEQERQGNLFVETENLDAYLDKIQKNAEFITHYSAGECAGFVAFYCNDKNKKNAYVTLVLLAPEFRGKGIASSLIRYTLEYCKNNKFEKCELEVRKDNYSAIRLYEVSGFGIERLVDERLVMSCFL